VLVALVSLPCFLLKTVDKTEPLASNGETPMCFHEESESTIKKDDEYDMNII